MINIDKVKTYSVKKRASKVVAGDFASSPRKKKSFLAFYDSLPGILKAKDLRDVVAAITRARKRKKSVILMCGAHVIKCGLSPVIIELIKKRVVTTICLNGAGVIHDFELALQARTSEDVARNLADGSFGMAREPAEFINTAVNTGYREFKGFGKCVAEKIAASKLPHKELSLIYFAHKYGVPVCVHVAIGTDIIHQHPSFDGACAGAATQQDFKTLAGELVRLNDGGVVLNFGSAVILPEVFLKALNLARNLGFVVKNFVTANFDMNYHYRPAVNIVSRPNADSAGKGYYIIGHHEIMLPLLAQAVIEKI
jgi:hypothetical protein